MAALEVFGQLLRGVLVRIGVDARTAGQLQDPDSFSVILAMTQLVVGAIP